MIKMSFRFLSVFVCAAALLVAVGGEPTAAFDRVQAAPRTEMREGCPGPVAKNGTGIIPAGFKLALNADQVRITYVGHSTFLIESSAARAHRHRL